MKLSHNKKAYPLHPNKIFISIRQICITILIYPLFIFFLSKLLLLDMTIVYLIPGNLSSSNYGIKEIKRRENLLKKWAFPNSKIKVFDVPMATYPLHK